MYYDVVMLTAISLLGITVAAIVLYYRRIREVQVEYEKARDVIGDIVVSFGREMEQQRRVVEKTVHRVEALSARNEKLNGELKEQKKKLAKLAVEIKELLRIKEKLSGRMEEIDGKLEKLMKLQKNLIERIESLEKRRIPEVPVKTREESPRIAIPFKREKVLAPLTDTELRVLKILAEEGEKRAPEIQRRIKLTREHTARLMKKLYTEGYLERDTSRIPYTYRIKKEMLEILKRAS